MKGNKRFLEGRLRSIACGLRDFTESMREKAHFLTAHSRYLHQRNFVSR